MSFTNINQLLTSLYSQANRACNLIRSSSVSTTITNGDWLEYFATAFGGTYSGTAGVAVAMNGSTVGALPDGPDVYPSSKHLIKTGLLKRTGNFPGSAWLVDMLLYYPSCAVTGTPTTLDNSVTLPRYTNGIGVMGIVVSHTALSTVVLDINVNYDSNENASQATNNLISTAAASGPGTTLVKGAVGGSPFIPINGTDTGIKKINSYTINSSGTGGTICFLLVKPIVPLAFLGQSNLASAEFLNVLPKIEDDACLGIIMSQGSSGSINSDLNVMLEVGW